ncbi:RNA polymerase sigma factor [Cellulomonas oligotrophica]|uniref:RNA polymerase sigma factor n=1 Tax=Cellulomonas oligotrophica TaxID=931536 RepID=A0A7Y9FIJ2_9CELL|nr:sigma-70 family RNA polymerase sigma factor [Cellulomonas oligotrophica]NYD86626.1 RNA polymerase sigma factor (sigma-70 family) [Cellulomonas oligotrophica]GIG34619.1 RNA polymerase sigma factor [Cellulomonas oligotrophica]
MDGGWRTALDALVDQRYGALVARATLVTGSRVDALDLVHDALVVAFSARARFASVDEAEQDVCRAVVTLFVGRRRRRRDRATAVLLAARARWATSDPEPDVLGADVMAALAELSRRERACVLLRHLDNLSVQETAQLLGLSEGSVAKHVSDGLARLDARLGTTSSTTDGPTVQVLEREETSDER